MASSLNASTSGGGGVIVTSDATGNLNIQSGGSTVVAVTATGVAVTGTLAATGASTFTGTGKFATTIGVGNATPAASGSGITFPATQSASSNANTLDDYEEGTYTPTIIFNTTDGNLTYSVQVGRYVKIGQTVYVGGQIVFAQTTASSYFFLNNLPFTSKNVANFNPSTGCGVENMNGLSGGIYIQVLANSVTAYPYQSQTGTINVIGAARCNGGSATISWGFTYLSDV